MGTWDSHSYHALLRTATRHMAVSRMPAERVVFVRMAPRKEFLVWMLMAMLGVLQCSDKDGNYFDIHGSIFEQEILVEMLCLFSSNFEHQ